tara:strand:- start:153 stop:374 length:222 start_codon:yes stop_codon:yes gene_type:complete
VEERAAVLGLKQAAVDKEDYILAASYKKRLAQVGRDQSLQVCRRIEIRMIYSVNGEWERQSDSELSVDFIAIY